MKCNRCAQPEEKRCLDYHCENLYDPVGATKKLHAECKDYSYLAGTDSHCVADFFKMCAHPRRSHVRGKICYVCKTEIDGHIGWHEVDIPNVKWKQDVCLSCFKNKRGYVKTSKLILE